MRTTKIITKNKIRIAIIEDEDKELIKISEIDKNNCGIFGMEIDVYKDRFIKNSKWNVSWSSIGSQNIEKTERYIELLKISIKIAKDKNLTSSKK